MQDNKIILHFILHSNPVGNFLITYMMKGKRIVNERTRKMKVSDVKEGDKLKTLISYKGERLCRYSDCKHKHTMDESYVTFPAGTVGIVAVAKIPKVTRRGYFLCLDVNVEDDRGKHTYRLRLDYDQVTRRGMRKR